MLSKVDTVLSTLADLSPAELRRVKSAFVALGAETPAVADAALVEADERIVYDGFSYVLIGTHKLPHAVFARSKDYPKFKAAAEQVLVFAREQFGVKRRNELIACVRLIAKLLASRAFHVTGRRPGMRTLIIHTSSLAAAVEREFPGYLDAGMLPMVFRAERPAAWKDAV